MELEENQRVIEELVTLPDKSEEEKKAEFELLRDNLDLILKYSDLIISTPEYYHSHLIGMPVGLAYMGGYDPPLGALLELWTAVEFIDACDGCGGCLYLVQAGGSPLSGSNKALGICGGCKKKSCKTLSRVGSILIALDHIKKNLNIRKKIRTKGQYFSFKEGLAGQPVPDQILQEAVDPVSISSLIHDLQDRFAKEPAHSD